MNHELKLCIFFLGGGYPPPRGPSAPELPKWSVPVGPSAPAYDTNDTIII